MKETLPPENAWASLLKEYRALQDAEREIREKKSALQERLAAHLEEMKATVWMPEVEGATFKVRYRKTVKIEYDEDVLQQRLGDRYALLLRPDWRKVRSKLDEVEPLLVAALPVIGTPDPARVKAAIDAGQVALDDFKDAFTRKEVTSVAVSRVGEPEAENPE
ncbi:MAG TPA: hypothetical protein PKE26_05375 [Kiritimatiellia bacterium]|nr:hypothetical protein [Kiritimatiellia bacterium]HMO98524.1 hypothetical protein [Kiritimatiellia bacterium]HMP95832.1 hypothetical protein [Kiritimatiellia bacterium]